MSAFVVSQNHINAIVTWANHRDRGCYAIADPTAIGQMLLNANNRSVRYRYTDADEQSMTDPEPFEWRPSAARRLSPVEALKAIVCLDYQCCEPDDYDGSQCHRALEQLKSQAISELEGYDAAPWAID